MASSSSLSSLGLGSNGVLTYDIIDKLKNVDKTSLINPLSTKLTSNQTKQNSVSNLATLLNTFQTSVDKLSDENTYLTTKVKVSNDDVSVSSSTGTSAQTFKIKVNTLANRDVFQSNLITSPNQQIFTEDDTLKITVNGKTIDFNVTSSTTIESLQNDINTQLKGDVTASLLKIDANNYRFVLKSNNTGLSNAITFDSTQSSTLSNLGFSDTNNHVSIASNASFLYNGINVERDKNTITDLISGVSITLNQQQDSSTSSTIEIQKDTESILENIKNFVESYNAFITQVNSDTSYSIDKKTGGVLQGDSTINALKYQFRAAIAKNTSANANIESLGITINRDNTLTLDETKFSELLNSDFSKIQNLFTNSEDKGYFDNLSNVIFQNDSDRINGTLRNYQLFLQSEETKISDNIEKTTTMLDERYEMMAKRFMAYDSIMSKLNSQFTALSSMIESQNSSNN